MKTFATILALLALGVPAFAAESASPPVPLQLSSPSCPSATVGVALSSQASVLPAELAAKPQRRSDDLSFCSVQARNCRAVRISARGSAGAAATMASAAQAHATAASLRLCKGGGGRTPRPLTLPPHEDGVAGERIAQVLVEQRVEVGAQPPGKGAS